MTAYEALWIIKSQLTKTEQNLEAIETLNDLINIINRGIHIDDEKTYTLEEAKEALELGEFDNLGTEAEHIKNHVNQTNTNEKAFDEMFDDALGQLDNLKLDKS